MEEPSRACKRLGLVEVPEMGEIRKAEGQLLYFE